LCGLTKEDKDLIANQVSDLLKYDITLRKVEMAA